MLTTNRPQGCTQTEDAVWHPTAHILICLIQNWIVNSIGGNDFVDDRKIMQF